MFGFLRRRPEDFRREIQAHLELEADRLMTEGASPAEAQLAARRRFGSVTAAEERLYDARAISWLDALGKDSRAGWRALTKYPVASTVAVLSFAGAIGAFTTTLLVRDAVFHRPPMLYRDADQLSQVLLTEPDRPMQTAPVPGPLFEAWQSENGGAAISAATFGVPREVRAGSQTVTLPIRGVTAGFFSALGAPAAVGRTLTADSAPSSVVVSYRVWQVLFEGRPDAIGDTLWIDNQAHTLVGVMPDSFWFATMEAQAWRPLESSLVGREARLEVVARRPDGLSPDQLADRLQRATDDYSSSQPSGDRRRRVRVLGMEGTPMGRAMALAFPFVLGACVALTMLIACANVAILVIAQWTAREHEISIRAALGASRGQVVRLLLTESLMLAAAGGVLGVCVTYALRGLVVSRAGAFVRFFDLSIPPALLLKAMAITSCTGIAAGLGPALLETRRLIGNPMRALRTAESARQRWRHALVVIEIAVTVALLVVTAGMIDSYDRQRTGEVGYETAYLLMARVENPDGVPIDTIAAEIAAMPGVASAAPSTSVPFLGVGQRQRMSADAAGSEAVQGERARIGASFFSTLGVPIRRGRAFTAADTATSRVVIVNETLGRQLLGDADPIGRRIWIGAEPHEVIGVVADYKNTALQNHAFDAKAFIPIESASDKTMTFVVRTSGDPAQVARDVRGIVRRAGAGNAVNVVTLDETIQVASEEILVGAAPLVPLIATALFLTTAGIYGVLAFAIARRSKELAVRMAIGATGRDLVRLVSAHSLRLVAVGAALGLGATFGLSRIVRAFGGGGSMLDPSLRGFLVPAGIIFLTAAAATWIPSRRAARVNPADVLRTL